MGTSKTEADAKEAEKVKEAKRKGRFQIVESEDKSQQKPKQVDRAHLYLETLTHPAWCERAQVGTASHPPCRRSHGGISSDAGADLCLPTLQPGGLAEGTRSGAFSPTGSHANSLLLPLKAILEGMAEQHESMKEVVAALQDSERGKHASLASLVAQFQEKHPAELVTSKSEVRGLPRCCYRHLHVAIGTPITSSSDNTAVPGSAKGRVKVCLLGEVLA